MIVVLRFARHAKQIGVVMIVLPLSKIVRVGTATVCVAGHEMYENEVGGDGPNVVEAVVACACDLVRFDERKSQRPVVEPDADDSEDASLFGW